MDIVSILVVVALIGVVCWALVTWVPMPAPFAHVLVGIAVVLTLLWVLHHIPLRLP